MDTACRMASSLVGLADPEPLGGRCCGASCGVGEVGLLCETAQWPAMLLLGTWCAGPVVGSGSNAPAPAPGNEDVDGF